MLPPGGVRKGVASCGGPLRICTGPLPYHIRSRRKTFCSNQLVPSRWQHTARKGHTSTQALIQPTSLQRQNSRANSSLARAKVAARKGHTPHQPVNKPTTSGTTGVGDDAQSILPAISPRASELSKEIARLGKLQVNYYDVLSRHRQSDVLWLTWEERREVPSSFVNGWITRPQKSRNSKRYGISLQNVFVPRVLGCISDINVRKKIVSWEQDTCKELAPLFKEMVISRAKVAHLAGFKSYFDYRSQKKMMDTNSVELFLKNLKSQIAPQTDAFMESALEQKMQALDYDFTIKKLRSKLRPGKTIRDYQLHDPEAQINWGDLAYYQGRKNGSFFAPKSPEDPDFSDYFPADHTVRSLLKSFGVLLGMSFQEILPGYKYYQAQVTSYLEAQGLTARFAEELDIFFVCDTTALNPRPLGFLILDLKERDGKAREIFCTTFCHSIMSHNDAQWKVQVPSIAIVSTYNRARPKKPTLLTHSEIEAFAHKLGHAIHRLARGSKATNGPRDFVEIPSIMAEFWAHDPHVLQRISCHYTYLKPEYLVGWTDSWKEKYPSKNLPPQPPQKPPLEMFSEIAFRRHPQNDLYLTLRLLWMSMFDLSIHSSSEEELRSMDIGVGCRQILDEWTGIFTPFDGKGESQNNSYLHWSILENYDTSVYCYLLAKVYTYDLWSKHFAKDPFNQRAGRRYRKIVLEHHDTPVSWNPIHNLFNFLFWKIFGVPRTHMEALTKFMGRKPNSRMFIKALKAPANRNQTFWRRMGIRMGGMW